MLHTLSEFMLYESHYGWIFGIVVFYFILIYGLIGQLFITCCHFLERKNLLQKITLTPVSKKQIQQEIIYSLQSICIFGLLSVLLIYLIRIDYIQLLPNTIPQILWGLLLLNVWNEIHFFVIHKTMHLPFFMKHVHQIHHKSYIPTIYSVYRFHWFEALLLGTLPLTIAPFISFSPLVFALYPICSLLINFAGHCNYRFGDGTGASWKLLSSNHHSHHNKAKKNFGFAINLFDKIFNSKADK